MGFGTCITEKRKQPIWEAIKNKNIDELLKGEMYMKGETIIYKEI
jgi:hypothetical protein